LGFHGVSYGGGGKADDFIGAKDFPGKGSRLVALADMDAVGRKAKLISTWSLMTKRYFYSGR
jgi:hypothetical protein